MSVQDQRTKIIQECIPRLIKQLTGFKDDDINMLKCEQFAWSIIRTHRTISTNSHEVRRLIKGTQERFYMENMGEYADYLGRLCDEVVQHPLCINHYEIDIHWSLLDFLFALAYNPTGALKSNKDKIKIRPLGVSDETEPNNDDDEELKYWKNVLKEDFVPVEKYSDDNSDLSDWSDAEKSTKMDHFDSNASSSDETHKNVITCSDPLYVNIKPPEKSSPFISFNGSNATETLKEEVQHSWWLTDPDGQSQVPLQSSCMEANFCQLYNRFLSETSNNLIRFSPPSTISEQHLMREILWLFHEPHSCTIFSVDENFNIKKRQNSSIPSVTVDGLTKYLEKQFIPYIRMMHDLRSFHKSVYNGKDCMPPHTIECYAANLHLHLTPIWEQLLAYEERLITPQDFEVNTLINMRQQLNTAFQYLQCLHDIHQTVYLNWPQYPAHICSAFLLASLSSCYQEESQTMKANLAMSLLLTAIRVFCEIIDTWWSQGRLDDWQEEYIVERINKIDQSVCVREYRKNKTKLIFVPTHVSQTIAENTLFQLLQEHSVEAGRTLNLLYEINRIGDLCNNCLVMEDKLYDTFIKEFLAKVKIFQAEVKEQVGSNAKQHTDEEVKQKEEEKEKEGEDDNSCSKEASTSTPVKNECNNPPTSILNQLTTQDEFLLTAFALNMDLNETGDEGDEGTLESIETATPNALNIYQQLQECTSCMLPLEELLIQTLSQILTKRIAFANSFVIKLYREEFMLLKHLRNIRKVFLLEASDLMHQFYTKLFKQIEDGDTWANATLLTIQLDDIISAKYPELSSLFCVDINSAHRCQTNKVYEAVDELVVKYNLNHELIHFITNDDLQAYNKIFRFLLKVKWGVTTLEKLPFPPSHKRRKPYAKFEMIDLIMRRLEQLRFWMIFALQNIHFHLMTYVLQSMGEQLDEKINNCENLKEMEMVHKWYLETVCEHCFLVDNLNAIKLGVEQLLGLICILNLEWMSCVKYIESNNPLSKELDDTSSDLLDPNYVTNSQIDAIELTYIRCHQYLANKLNNEVYLKKKQFLSGLSAAFNTSVPY